MNRLLRCFFLLALAGLNASTSLQAATVTWNVASGDFATATNWLNDLPPVLNDTVVIQNGGMATLSTDYTLTAATLNPFTVGTTNNSGNLVLDTNAVLTINNTSTASSTVGKATSPTALSTLVVKDNARLTFNAYAGTSNNGRWFLLGGGTTNVDRATMTIQDTSAVMVDGFQVGNTSSAALYQTGGTLQVDITNGVPSRDRTFFGLGVGGTTNNTAYGYLDVSGGAIIDTDEKYVNQTYVGYYGIGVLKQSGGTVNVSSLSVGGYTGTGTATAFGEYNMSGGTFDANHASWGSQIGRAGTGVINLSGGTMSFNRVVNLGYDNVATSMGIINIGVTGTPAGTLRATQLQHRSAAPNSKGIVNFHGGTLKPIFLETDNANFLNGTTNYVYGEGAVIDTDGNDATITSALLVPAGSGVSSIALDTNGEGYIGAPVVKITGDGVGATAVAVFDNATGKVTGITITNPGTGYTTATAVLGGGGLTTAATLGTVGLNSGNVSGGLIKRGVGTLTLSGANTYMGMTTVENGTLKIAAATALPGQVTIHTDGTLATATTMTLSGQVLGTSGTLAVHSGALTLGSNAFSGKILMSGGNLDLTATHPGTLDVNNVASWYHTGTGSVAGLTSVGSSSSGTSQDALLGGTGTLGNVAVRTNYGNSEGVKGGIEAGVNGVGSLHMADLTFNGPGFVYVGNSTTGILNAYKTNAALIASGALTIGAETAGMVKFDLGGANVAAGTYHLIQHTGAISYLSDTSPANFEVINAILSARQTVSIVDNAGSGSMRFLDYVVTGAYPVWSGLVGGATNNTWTPNNHTVTNWKSDIDGSSFFFIDATDPLATGGIGDAVLFTDAAGSAHSTVNISSNVAPVSVLVDSTMTYTFNGTAGIIDGTSATKTSLTKRNSGMLVINTPNTYSGGTTIYDGTIGLGNASALGAGGVTFYPNASATAKLQLFGTSISLSGLTTDGVAPGTPVVENGGSIDATLTLTNATANTYAGLLQDGAAGKLGVTFAGYGKFTLTGVNAYSGDTTFSDFGNLAIGFDNALPHGAGKGNLVFAGGSLDLNGHNLTVNGLANPGAMVAIANNLPGITATLTVGDGNTDSDFSGAFLDNGTGIVALAKIGLGRLTLNNPGPPWSNYSGGTTLAEGTIQTGYAAALGTGTVDMAAGTTLDLIDTALSVNGLTGSGRVTTSASGSFPVLTLTLPAAATTSFAGLIENGSGTMGLTKAGAGTVTFASNHTYTGVTTLSGGMLSVASLANGGVNSPLGASSADATNLIFNGGGLTYIGSSITIDRAFNNAGIGEINVANKATALEFTGIITNTGTGTFTKSGEGTLALNNAEFNNLSVVAGVLKGQTGGTVKVNELNVGVNGAAAVYLDSTLLTNATAATNGWYVARNAGSYGYVDLSGTSEVTNTVMNQLQLGNRGTGIIKQSGGSMTLSAIAIGCGATTDGDIAEYNMSGGVFEVGKIDYNSQVGYRGMGVLNLSGGTMSFRHDIGAGAIYVGWKGGKGIVNIGVKGTPGGTLAVTSMFKEAAGDTGVVNFHGGTLKAITSTTGLNAKFLDNTTNYVYGGGAKIDTDGNDVTISSPLLAPVGQGVESIELVGQGEGYIGAPFVQITGDGIGATAVAVFDKATGTVTGISVTNPGTGYTTAPTVTLVGGGSTTAATLGTVGLNVANVSGGLTKLGAGTLTLAGALTYTGATTIGAGTLQISTPGAVTLSTIAGAGALKVTDATTLNATSIAVDTLTIGGAVPAVAAVPEPTSLALLAMILLGLLGGAWWKRRN